MNASQAIQAHLGGTQRATAAVLGVTYQQWNRYLRGRACPSADAVRGWCEKAGVVLRCDGAGWCVEQQQNADHHGMVSLCKTPRCGGWVVKGHGCTRYCGGE